jgi:plastocyanin
MIEELWTGLLAFAGKFIVPDWGSLIGLIPLGLVAIVFFYLTWTAYRFATAAPMRRGMRKLPPVAPAGIHMPGPSFAPLLAAFGAFMLMFGMVTGGIWTYVGVSVLVITLLYWGREALRDYDQVAKHDADAPAEAAAVAIPAGPLRPPVGTPPPGVHIPPPSFRPLLVSISMTMLVAGMIFGGWALLFGIVAVVVTGLGWLRDSRHEYAAVAATDTTGHLEPGTAPDWPKATFAALAVIVAAALLLSSNIMPIVQVVPLTSGAPGASGGPAASGGGGVPTPVPSLPVGDVNLTAQSISFTSSTLDGPAGKAFTIVLNNVDPVPHNVEIKDGSGASKFKGALDNGPAVTVYSVDPLPAGQYTFVCSVHPNMTGTLTLK